MGLFYSTAAILSREQSLPSHRDQVKRFRVQVTRFQCLKLLISMKTWRGNSYPFIDGCVTEDDFMVLDSVGAGFGAVGNRTYRMGCDINSLKRVDSE